jgi:Activator of Hsp90 ATPase homolog 1-like protein
MARITIHMRKKSNVNGKNFTTAISMDQTPEEVFDAINNVRGWWSEEIEGSTDKTGVTFKFRYKDLHRSTQKITEWVPGKKVVWHVVDSRLAFVKDKDEWNGTDIVFDIAKKGGKTELRFTHVGLVPALECYEACKDGWGFYIKNSLKGLITTGKGQPETKEKGLGKKAD